MIAHTILIVDDDEDLRSILIDQLSLHPEFQILQEDTAEKAIQTATHHVQPRHRRGTEI